MTVYTLILHAIFYCGQPALECGTRHQVQVVFQSNVACGIAAAAFIRFYTDAVEEHAPEDMTLKSVRPECVKRKLT